MLEVLLWIFGVAAWFAIGAGAQIAAWTYRYDLKRSDLFLTVVFGVAGPLGVLTALFCLGMDALERAPYKASSTLLKRWGK